MSNNPETPDTPGTPRTPGTPERAQPETGGIPSDPTRAIEVDQPSTSSAGAGESVWADEGTANRTEPLDTAILGRYDDTLPDDARATEAGRAHEDRAHDGQARNGQAQAWPPAVPPRPTGLHLPPILLGMGPATRPGVQSKRPSGLNAGGPACRNAAGMRARAGSASTGATSGRSASWPSAGC